MMQFIPNNIQLKGKLKKEIKLKKYSKSKVWLYFYTINYTRFEENLCNMEMKYLFNKVPQEKHFYSYHYVDPSRSPFIKQCLAVMYTSNTLEEMVQQITNDNLHYEMFKVFYFNANEESVSFHEKRRIESLIGLNILGEAEMQDPKILLSITKVREKWILGKYKTNNSIWLLHNKKPYSYSNALNARVSRAIVNIAVANNLKSKVVDPCCGIGTVVIEALSQGIDIKGYEINPFIAENARKNLHYLEYDDVISNTDMHTIDDNFDVAIVDLPYGLFLPTTIEEQVGIIKRARKIASSMVIVTLEDMEQYILSSGFHIMDRCYVCKGKFKRYISICK